MILDTLAQSSRYHALSPRFEKAFAYLRTVTEQTPPGRYEIDGDDLYAFVQQHSTKPVAERQYESHRKYIDIQFMLRGREIMVWAPLALMTTVTMPFDVAKDAALYALIPDGVSVEVRAGQFAIFYPEDAHIPSCAWGQPAEVLKVVVKVRV
ncbi:MAG: YhcH/YjgK/YiaL family protein [Opitutaceae bacterium]